MVDLPPENLLHSPLESCHKAANARLVPFAGWLMPLTYEGQLAEHLATRQGVGLFDVSHMGQVEISGPGAVAFMQTVFPADLAALELGKSRYTFLLNDQGGILDDLIISRRGRDSFFLVVNAANAVADHGEVVRLSSAHEGVTVTDVSPRWAMIAVQGPGALSMLESLLPAEEVKWSGTDAFTLHEARWRGVECLVSRTGYTGEDGAEVLCPPEISGEIWEALVAAGGVPCGLAARDSLRLEAGYPLHGNDLSPEVTPVEAGLSWAISWDKGKDYPGCGILKSQKEQGPPRRRIALRTGTRKPLRKGDVVLHEGGEIGVVTSGGYSPGLECGIALALVVGDQARHDVYHIRSGNREMPCERTRTPFAPIGLQKKSKPNNKE